MTDITIWLLGSLLLYLLLAAVRDYWQDKRNDRNRNDMRHLIGAKPWWGRH